MFRFYKPQYSCSVAYKEIFLKKKRLFSIIYAIFFKYSQHHLKDIL